MDSGNPAPPDPLGPPLRDTDWSADWPAVVVRAIGRCPLAEKGACLVAEAATSRVCPEEPTNVRRGVWVRTRQWRSAAAAPRTIRGRGDRGRRDAVAVNEDRGPAGASFNYR